ncbi:hypothetical protein GcM3_223036 [Golovinomyces cichoracearum]|uniref:Uncharacterized protein n=1 Tax=Golovinomyces cichoracearum TaxID=62708 RepID=A0A420H1N9_9PEZI|nr:hypothetical protein GcM3_223036 [Golovinomyces cichoracearum]
MRDFLISNGVKLQINYGGKNKTTISRSLFDLTQAEKLPPMTSYLIDWGTEQGFDMDSPSIRRIENGQSPEWTAEELRQIREQKRLEKMAKANCPENSSPDINGNLAKGKQVKKNSTEDWSHHANQQILDEEKYKFERHQRTQEEQFLRENLLTLLQQQATVDNSLTSPVMMQETSQTT